MDEGDGVADIGKVSGRKRARVNYAEVAGEDVYEDGRAIARLCGSPACGGGRRRLPPRHFDQEIEDCGRAPSVTRSTSSCGA